MSNLIDHTYSEVQLLPDFAEQAYLNYSMYVILDRALPHIGDGLKPVQRRIVYAMSELGLAATNKRKKSAHTVGDVLGKYHPHGDRPCYEAMVLMAQPFSYRYPLVDGQGNWGSSDNPKSFAAMRYTEARLSPYAQLLLAELGQGTTEWQPNFDGSLDEPCLLPSRIPNILLNGTTGIAVGMATDIPPHNLRETIAACIHLMDHPDASIDVLMQHLPAPDFATGGEIITPAAELRQIYLTGNGTLRVRARYHVEDGQIVITELPWQVSGEKLLVAIEAQRQQKKLPMVEDLRDESDHENPVRLVLVLRSNRVDAHLVMNHLFATTSLENSYRVNMNMIGLNGKPQTKPLIPLLLEWLHFRRAVVRKRFEYRLQKIEARLHILDGLLVAYLHIDEVIEIIRNEDKPKPVLMTRFDLSEIQADAILDIRLRQLAKLEEISIRAEQEELNSERNTILEILGNPKKLDQVIRQELIHDAAQYGDDRRSPIVVRESAQALDETQLTPSEVVTVILSKMGWVRTAKGKEIDAEGLPYRTGDQFLMSAVGRSNQQVVFLDRQGRSYCALASSFPSARGNGDPLTGRFSDCAEFNHLLIANPEDSFLLASTAGYGFICQFGSMLSRNKAGKAMVTLPDAAQLLPPIQIPTEAVQQMERTRLIAITQAGRMLILPLSSLPELAKGKGNQIIGIPSAKAKAGVDKLVNLIILPPDHHFAIKAGRLKLVMEESDLTLYTGERGKRGKELPRGLYPIKELILLPNCTSEADKDEKSDF